MGETTGIQWTDATYNPWYGCRKVSPACAHCYMFRDMRRYGRDPDKVVRASVNTFRGPLNWPASLRIFTCSWSDFFIEEADPWREDAYVIMDRTPRHTYQILTKRPERAGIADWPEKSWLGVSVENRMFYRRIERLQKLDAAVRFLSIEPLLGPMPDLPLDNIQWVIVGGESGAKFRPFNLEWARQIKDSCLDLGIPFFLKQKSGLIPKRIDRTLDGREWNELPDLAPAERGRDGV